MDDFFKKIKNNEPVLKNVEDEVDSNEAEDKPNAATPCIKENQSDNLKFVGSITKPATAENEVVKDDVIRKPTHTGEVNEEFKFSYFTESAIEEDTKPKVNTEAAYEPNELERMLEEAGETTDFLS